MEQSSQLSKNTGSLVKQTEQLLKTLERFNSQGPPKSLQDLLLFSANNHHQKPIPKSGAYVRERRMPNVGVGGARETRYVTKFTSAQKTSLEEEFKRRQYPNLADREIIAGRLGITDKVVWSWFCNRRRREQSAKKEKKKTSSDTEH